MARQSRLENIGIDKREEDVVRLDYNSEPSRQYSENHKDAISDGDPLGKGAGSASNIYLIPNEKASTETMGITINTTNGGGKYDIEGKDDVYEGKNGRNWAMSVNIYGPENPYGTDSIDTTKNVKAGQYVVTNP